MNTNPSSGRKRARLFGDDPFPGFVFSLDTSKKKLPLDLFKASCAQSKPPAATGDESGRAPPLAAEGGTPSSINNNVSAGPSMQDMDTSGALAPCYTVTASASPVARATIAPTTPAKSPAVGIPTAAVDAVGETPAETLFSEGTLPVAAEAVSSPFNRPGVQQHEHQSPGLHDAPTNEATTAVTPAAPAEPSEPAPPSAASTTTAVGPHRQDTHARAGVVTDTSPAAVISGRPTNLDTQSTPRGDGGGIAGSAAASMVASFLKRGSTLPPTAAAKLSPGGRPHFNSPPKTPTPLASIVAGVPPGSGTGSSGGSIGGRGCYSGERRRTGDRTPNAGGPPGGSGGDSRIQSPRRGSNHFLHEDWPPVLKRRRRILSYNPRGSAAAGSRIVYWIRGNYRVKDNQGLSVAMWLSTELRLPLQAVTFVDSAIGMPLRSRPSPSSSAKRATRLSGGGEAQRVSAQRQDLPFRVAVEASGLCEMEQALRAFNVPLVAISCAEGDIPSTLACWCSGRDWEGTGRRAESAGVRTPPASGAPAAAAAGAAAAAAAPGSTTATAAAQGLSTEGSVRIAIMDESYHPRQLSLSKKVKDALRGTAALYAVDSSSVYPVNMSGGAANKITSPEEFRRAQDDCLPTVIGELTPRPRLPLEPQLQNQLFTGGDKRAMLPHAFEHRATASSAASAFVIDWHELREISAHRFPGFGKPISRQLMSSTKDLIPILGGGERVGEAALEQALGIIASPAPENLPPTGAGAGLGLGTAVDDHWRSQLPSQQPPPSSQANDSIDSLEREAAGLGFGGCLLHLLRLGSLSSLSVVQALFHDFHTGAGPDEGGGQAPKMCQARRQILGAVLRREYALYRSRLYHREMDRGSSTTVLAATTPGGSPSAAAAKGQEWRGKDHWMGLVPAWVWEELTRGQRDARQHLHSPGEIRLAGSEVPSSVDDELFSAIQGRLTNGGRLCPSLAPYWARAVVKMMLSPPQAVSLLVGLAEEFAIGATHAGDIIPDLLDSAFGVLRTPPPTAAAECGGASPPQASEARRRETPVFRRLVDPPLATEEGLRSAFGGRDAFAQFLSRFPLTPVPTPPPPAS